jgi:hypothetical protein
MSSLSKDDHGTETLLPRLRCALGRPLTGVYWSFKLFSEVSRPFLSMALQFNMSMEALFHSSCQTILMFSGLILFSKSLLEHLETLSADVVGLHSKALEMIEGLLLA